MDDDLIAVLARLHRVLMRHSYAAPFNKPVSEEEGVSIGYFVLIVNPMDLGTVLQKLRQHDYVFLPDYVIDTNLVFHNAMKWVAKCPN